MVSSPVVMIRNVSRAGTAESMTHRLTNCSRSFVCSDLCSARCAQAALSDSSHGDAEEQQRARFGRCDGIILGTRPLGELWTHMSLERDQNPAI